MKANEFVKSTNIENVKFILEGVESEHIEISAQVDGIYMFDTVSVSDLKRLVEAHELVKKLGGLSSSKGVCNNGLSDDDHIRGYTSGVCHVVTKISDLKQAIADVESCQ